MSDINKGFCPFYPGQPIPVSLFTGRAEIVRRLMSRGARQVALGKSVAVFVQGEYGIGKSSIANYVQSAAEAELQLFPIYATLGGAENLNDVAASILEGILRSGATTPTRLGQLGDWIARLVEPQLFGVKIDLKALKQEAPNISSPFALLSRLKDIHARLERANTRGLFLVLDEINGITKQPKFAHFIKSLIDANANDPRPLPFLLMLCGVEERRKEMIQQHPSMGRLFDVIPLSPMNDQEMREFFQKAFESVRMRVEDKALAIMTHYSGGLPKIMHEIGASAFWVTQDQVVSEADAVQAVRDAKDEIGRKYVEPEVYLALKSEAYHTILAKLGKLGKEEFSKAELAAQLSVEERKKLNNFLQRLKKLHVLGEGKTKGTYAFKIRIVQVYIMLKSLEVENVSAPAGPNQPPLRNPSRSEPKPPSDSR